VGEHAVATGSTTTCTCSWLLGHTENRDQQRDSTVAAAGSQLRLRIEKKLQLDLSTGRGKPVRVGGRIGAAAARGRRQQAGASPRRAPAVAATCSWRAPRSPSVEAQGQKPGMLAGSHGLSFRNSAALPKGPQARPARPSGWDAGAATADDAVERRKRAEDTARAKERAKVKAWLLEYAPPVFLLCMVLLLLALRRLGVINLK
jgi:hypothetical protein